MDWNGKVTYKFTLHQIPDLVKVLINNCSALQKSKISIYIYIQREKREREREHNSHRSPCP